MPNNAVGWFEIYVQDMPRAKAFYQRLLGIQLERLNAPEPGLELWSFPMNSERYGIGGALVRMEGFASGGNSTLVYFSCDDCATEASRIVEAGGQLLREKFAIGEYGFIALGVDTEGNRFGLHSMR